MKKRICITIDKSIIQKIDTQIDNKKIKNRSHAIELLLSKSMGDHVPKVAVILAGGKGTRLRPLTYLIPKALIPVRGRSITEHIFDLFKKYGVHDVIMAVGHMRRRIKIFFGDGKRFKMNIRYVEEKKPLGTAGPLRLAKKYLKEAFILSHSDELQDIDIADMYDHHKRNSALVTIALTTVSDPSHYGVVKLSGNKILQFIEKPKKEEAPSNLINSGFCIVEPEVIDMIPKGFVMLERDIFPKLAKMGRLYGYPFSGQWFDTGNFQRYKLALKKWKEIR